MLARLHTTRCHARAVRSRAPDRQGRPAAVGAREQRLLRRDRARRPRHRQGAAADALGRRGGADGERRGRRPAQLAGRERDRRAPGVDRRLRRQHLRCGRRDDHDRLRSAMCRWLAYSGSPIRLEELLVKRDRSLIDQSLHSRLGATTTNGDGFGVGWYDDTGTPRLYRSVHPAWNDRNLRELAAGDLLAPLPRTHPRVDGVGDPGDERASVPARTAGSGCTTG